MAWTQADVDTLKAAIASGVLTVRFDGPPARTYTYQSVSELLQALAVVEGQVSGKTRYRLVSTRKGFDAP